MTVVDKTSIGQKTVGETPWRPQLDRIEETRKKKRNFCQPTFCHNNEEGLTWVGMSRLESGSERSLMLGTFCIWGTQASSGSGLIS